LVLVEVVVEEEVGDVAEGQRSADEEAIEGEE